MSDYVAIVGSRKYPRLDYVRKFFDTLPERTTIISGGADGVDAVAEKEARLRCLPVKIFKPDWTQGKGAGLARNTEIINACDRLAAFWDGESRGTMDSVRKARAAGKPVLLFGPDGKLVDGDVEG